MCTYVCDHSRQVKMRGELGAGSFIPLAMKLRFPSLQSKHFFPLSHFTSLKIRFYFYMQNSSSIFSTERKRIDYICMAIWKYFHKFASQYSKIVQAGVIIPIQKLRPRIEGSKGNDVCSLVKPHWLSSASCQSVSFLLYRTTSALAHSRQQSYQVSGCGTTKF